MAREQPEVRRPVATNSKMLPEPRVPDHRGRVAADEHGPPRLEAVVVVELVAGALVVVTIVAVVDVVVSGPRPTAVVPHDGRSTSAPSAATRRTEA